MNSRDSNKLQSCQKWSLMCSFLLDGILVQEHCTHCIFRLQVMYSHVSATIKGLVRKHCGTFHSRIGIVLETRKEVRLLKLIPTQGAQSIEFIGLIQRGFCPFSDGDGFPITSLARHGSRPTYSMFSALFFCPILFLN